MLKKGLFIVAAVAMLAMSAQAGEIKYHSWPTTYTALPICTVNVTMDVGYWIQAKSQTKTVKLTQSASNMHNYDGCTNLTFGNNFACILTASIARVALPGDKYIVANSWNSYLKVDFGAAGVTTYNMDAGGNNVVPICAHIVGAQLDALSAGSKDIKVAEITIMVVPQT